MEKATKSVLCVFMLLTYLSGTAVATFVPVMSLFLTDFVKANSVQVGVYFTTAAVVGIIVTQLFAKFSDKNTSRKFLVVLAAIFGMFVALIFVLIPNYYVIITAGVFCLSVSCVATPQIFASGREYSILHYGNSVMFTTYMRSFFALAWVIAPPIAYLVANSYGFQTLFIATAVIFAISSLIALFFMPDTKKLISDNILQNKKVDVLGASNSLSLSNDDKILGNKDVMLLFLAVTLLWTCNNLYLISMPIVVKNELQISESLPGFMMATAAFLEIPIMIFGGYLSKRIGIKPLTLGCALSGVLFYTLLVCAPTSVSLLLCIQIFNAIFIGILAGLGMIYFQDLLPKIPGQATTLFNNAVNTGAILSGGVIAIVVQFGSYSYSFVTSIVLTFIAFIVLFFVRKV